MWGGLTLIRCACHPSSPCIAHPPLRSMYAVIFSCRGAVTLVAFIPPSLVFALLLPVIALCLRCASPRIMCVVSVCGLVHSFIRTFSHVPCPSSMPSSLCGLLCVVRRSIAVLFCILTLPCPRLVFSLIGTEYIYTCFNPSRGIGQRPAPAPPA